MGTASTKLKRHLINGDEYAVLEMLHRHPDLGESLNPNRSVGDQHNNSALHLASKFAMKPLIRLFLYELFGNPNRQNSKGQTPLHLVCSIPVQRQFEEYDYTVYSLGSAIKEMQLVPCEAVQERRAMCAALLLQWRKCSLPTDDTWLVGPTLDKDVVDLTLLDTNDESALHYAAFHGLKKCVQLLLDWNAPIFLENKMAETACDLAYDQEFSDICEFLEYNMVFFGEECSAGDVRCRTSERLDLIECSRGLSYGDLQETKEQLVEEVASWLKLTKFEAEALLRSHEWSREVLREEWYRDKKSLCERVGLTVPDIDEDRIRTGSAMSNGNRSDSRPRTSSANGNQNVKTSAHEESVCSICTCDVHQDDLLRTGCGHRFCRLCWKAYLEHKLFEDDPSNLFCPEFNCMHFVQIELIEKVLPTQLTQKFLQFDLNTFVDSNPEIKWCPEPGCERAVRLNDDTIHDLWLTESAPSWNRLPDISIAVDCGSNHYFCWGCLDTAHAPVSCDLWAKWKAKMADLKVEDIQMTYSKTDEAASNLWVVKYAKLCPNCKAPIQKIEGCNHMRCSKCRFEFCWICLSSWKHHNGLTGGFYRCSQSDVAERIRQLAKRKKELESENSDLFQLRRFVRYQNLFREHQDGYEEAVNLLTLGSERQRKLMEKYDKERMRLKSGRRISECCDSSLDPGAEVGDDTRNRTFLVDAIVELKKARRILLGLTVFRFYLVDRGFYRIDFDTMEKDFKYNVDQLTRIVSKAYIQVPRIKIVKWTRKVTKKRLDMLRAVYKGLLPPTPDPVVKMRNKHRSKKLGQLRDRVAEGDLDMLDESERAPVVEEADHFAALNGLGAKDPWVIDPVGHYWSLFAILDWSDYVREESWKGEKSDSKLCHRANCSKLVAENPRTAKKHQYCSLKCKLLDDSLLGELALNSSSSKQNLESIGLEILMALERSRPRAALNSYSNKLQRADMDIVEEETRDILRSAYLEAANDDEDGSSVFDSMLAELSRPASPRRQLRRQESDGSTLSGGPGPMNGPPDRRNVAQRAISFFLNGSDHVTSTEATGSNGSHSNEFSRQLSHPS
ncbi:Ankyrin repeat and IBR domain-containing protein 1 [Halotydeus destructor]|nr:Ankyrin repeat and IBR domain-containing protein 1 [Halotydeus destructor]